MAKWKITATYEHEGVVSGETENQAEQNFLASLNRFYVGTVELDIEMVCEKCEGDLDLDDSCFDCRDEEEN